jgi:hypothetical protein
LLVPLLGLGVTAWAVHRKLGDRRNLDEGWEPLPPAPHPVPAARSAAPVPPAAVTESAEDIAPPVPEHTAVASVAIPVPEPVPVASVEPEPVVESPEPAPVVQDDSVERPRARAVAAVAAVASVTAPAAPALPDAPFGPGSVRALGDGSSPHPEFAVKGKIATKVFHVPGGAYYSRTRADVWFRSARDARGAGFTERTRRHA